MSNIKKYVPGYYYGVYEFESLMQVNDVVFDKVSGLLDLQFANHFVTQADENGVQIFEAMYNITPDDNETLDIRKSNIILKMLPAKPITIKYFKELVNLLNIPTNISVDYANFFLNAESDYHVINENQLNKLISIIKTYVPANIDYLIKRKSGSTSDSSSYIGTGYSISTYTESKLKEVN